MTKENLYTSGNEFVLPDGTKYVGAYHIHVNRGAMVGAVHSPNPHPKLTPVSRSVRSRVRSIQRQLKKKDQASTVSNQLNRTPSLSARQQLSPRRPSSVSRTPRQAPTTPSTRQAPAPRRSTSRSARRSYGY